MSSLQAGGRDVAMSVMAGLVVGIMGVVSLTSYSALIFSGELVTYLAEGIGIALLAGTVIALVIALSSSYRGAVALPQDIPAAVFSVVAAEMAVAASFAASQSQLFPTLVTTLMLTSLVMGVLFLALGTCKLGGLIRFIPYPVIGGFLAATGWVLIGGSIGLMTGVSLAWANLPHLLAADAVVGWGPGILFGLVALVVTRRIRHALCFPALLAAALLLFYLLTSLSGIGFAELSAGGWLLGPFPEGGGGIPIKLAMVTQADWAVVFQQMPSVGTILLISVIGLLLNASALELAIKRDVDLNQELRAAGLANLLAAPVGGMMGYQYLGSSVLANRMGGRTRLVGLTVGVVCGAMFLAGTSLLSYLPKFLLGGLIAFVGFDFLLDWLYGTWHKLKRFEYMIVVLIFGVSISVGFLEGVAVGILASSVLFILEYSRVRVVKHALSGQHFHSNVDRADPQLARLHDLGSRILVLKLQGFIFFGTATRLLERVRGRLERREEPLRFLVLDFRLVSGLDSSAVMSFTKMKQLAESEGFQMVFTNLPTGPRDQLAASELLPPAAEGVHVFEDCDRAVEWCENDLLHGAGLEPYGYDEALSVFLERELGSPDKAERVLAYLERRELEKGAHLMRQGDETDALYFIESGKVAVELELGEDEPVRLRSIGPGTVGEIGLYIGLPRTASVVAEDQGTVHRLSAAALARMERDDPDLAAAFHKFIARRLANRLADTTEVLQRLLE
jgi:SulP family sulfate permease